MPGSAARKENAHGAPGLNYSRINVTREKKNLYAPPCAPTGRSSAGSAPGVHTVGFDGPADVITLTHEVRDRAVFARGALEAAKWLKGRRGWFSMKDMVV